MNWMAAAVVLAVGALCMGVWAWITQRQRTKNCVALPHGDVVGLIAYRRSGASGPMIVVRREGFFGTRVGGTLMGLIVGAPAQCDHFDVYWSATKLFYKSEVHQMKLRPSGYDHHTVCASVEESAEEVVLAEQEHVRKMKWLHEARNKHRGRS